MSWGLIEHLSNQRAIKDANSKPISYPWITKEVEKNKKSKKKSSKANSR